MTTPEIGLEEGDCIVLTNGSVKLLIEWNEEGLLVIPLDGTAQNFNEETQAGLFSLEGGTS